MSCKIFREGKQLCLEGDLDHGLKMIREAVDWKPREVQFLANYAFWLQESKQYRKAIEVATKVLRLRFGSKNVMSHCVTFNSSLRLGDIMGCEIALNRMERCRSKQTKRLCKVVEKRRALEEYVQSRREAESQHELQDPVRTIQECEKGLRLAPFDPDLLGHKLWALCEQERYADLIEAHRSAHPTIQAKILETMPETVAEAFYSLDLIQEATQVLEGTAGRDISSFMFLQKLKTLKQYQRVLESDKNEIADRLQAIQNCLRVWSKLPENVNRKIIPLKKKLLINGISVALELKLYEKALSFINQLVLLHLPQEEAQEWREKSTDLSEFIRISGYPNHVVSRKRAFDIFRLSNKASWEEVQNQRKLLLKKYHPDKNKALGRQVWYQCYKSLTQELNKCFNYLEVNHDFQAQKKQLGKLKKKSGSKLTYQEEADRLVAEAIKMCREEEKRRERMARRRL